MTQRPWDEFLTEADRALDAALPSRSPKPALGDRPALLLIDLYRKAFGDRPEPLLEAIRTNPDSLGTAGWEALPHIQMLLDGARSAKRPIIHVTRAAGIPRWRDLGSSDGSSQPDPSGYEIIEPLKPLAGEVVIEKIGTSAFLGTPLVSILNELDIDTLVVAGEATSGCVRATVVDGRNLRYSIMVPFDCVFDRTELSHAANLYDMHRKYADVVELNVAMKYLSPNGFS